MFGLGAHIINLIIYIYIYIYIDLKLVISKILNIAFIVVKLFVELH